MGEGRERDGETGGGKERVTRDSILGEGEGLREGEDGRETERWREQHDPWVLWHVTRDLGILHDSHSEILYTVEFRVLQKLGFYFL